MTDGGESSFTQSARLRVAALRPGGTFQQDIRECSIRAQFDDAKAAREYAETHAGAGPPSRYFGSRLYAMMEALVPVAGGDLLDVGCGPGVFVGHLLQERSHDFRINALDISPAMIRLAYSRVGAENVRFTVGRAESLPFADRRFDVVTGAGVLEYVDCDRALDEMVRVTRPGGLILVTMLNPRSHYRLFEWVIYWPLLRALGNLEQRMGVAVERQHGVARSGIRAVPSARLCRMLSERGLHVDDLVYYDRNILIPPIDRILRHWRRPWNAEPETTTGRTWPSRWTGTAYMVRATKVGSP